MLGLFLENEMSAFDSEPVWTVDGMDIKSGDKVIATVHDPKYLGLFQKALSCWRRLTGVKEKWKGEGKDWNNFLFAYWQLYKTIEPHNDVRIEVEIEGKTYSMDELKERLRAKSSE